MLRTEIFLMSKKISILFKVFGVIFILLGLKSVIFTVIVNLFSSNTITLIVKLILNIGYIVLGVICLLAKTLDIHRKSINTMILLNGLIFIYYGVSQCIGGGSIVNQKDTLLPGLNAIGGTLSMFSGVLCLITASIFIVIGVLGLKRLKYSFWISIVLAVLLLAIYIFLKVKINFGIISLNIIFLFISSVIVSTIKENSF